MSSYATASELKAAPDGNHLDLATALAATPSGLVQNPVFFTGFLSRPDIAAAGMLAVADVAGSRYADAGLMGRLANLDPVVTASGDRLRFESFSACNGVHARLDLLPEALCSGQVGFGTTNVDINQPLRTALARVHRDQALHLSVGKEELRASSLEETHVERRVNLPERWIRGLAEVPALTEGMTRVGQLTGVALAGFFADLPRSAPPGPHVYLVPSTPRWRHMNRRLPGAIPLTGASRLRGCERIARHARSVTVHTAPNDTTAWVFDLPGARFTLVLSPDPYRGFSGEGTLLMQLTRNDTATHGQRLLTALDWSPTVDKVDLALRTGMTPGETAAGLAWLAGAGRLGYDLSETAWFHRELPINADKVLRRHPRLTAAHKLLEDGAVTRTPDGWEVSGSHDNHYAVTMAAHDPNGNPRLRCQCAWELEHSGTRGPCKHILAITIALRSP